MGTMPFAIDPSVAPFSRPQLKYADVNSLLVARRRSHNLVLRIENDRFASQ
jgi:hypothetical protein